MALKRMIFTMAMLIIVWHAHSQEEPVVTLEMNDTSLKEIIRELEQLTYYSFIYNETIDLKQKKSIKIKKQNIKSALNLIFNQTNIECKINKRHITLSNKKRETTTQKVTISGYITDAESSEILIGANIYDKTSGTGTTSNEFGFFSLTLPPGEVELRFSYTGYAMETQKISLTKNKNINIRLKTNLQLKEVVVIGKEHNESGINATQMSAIDIPINILKTTPVQFGEADVMKTIQMLPGVQAGTQGSAGVYVRGGGPDENLILLDGIPLYNIDHLFGLFSVFSPEAVKKATLFKGSFPARFGGRLSSVIDVRTNDGDMHNYHGVISVGLLSSKLQFEGPIIKGRTSFNISARRSYLDLLMNPFLTDGEKISIHFYDLNAKLNHKFNDKSRLFISFYNGKDVFGTKFQDNYDLTKSEDKTYTNWGNTMIAGRWNYIFSPKLFSNTTIALTNYRYGINTSMYTSIISDKTTKNLLNNNYRSGIKDWAYNLDFDYYPIPNHHIKFGARYLYHDFNPEVESLRIRNTDNGISTDTTYSNLANSHIYANEFSVYAEDDVDLTPRLSVNAGIHFSLFNVKNTNYVSLQPRLSARYQLKDNMAIKASYTKMNQYIHLLSSYNITLPSDLWVPTTDRIKPMRAHQYSLGAYYTGIKSWEFSAETYYKDMRNILEYKDGATFLGSSHNWEEKVEMGKGRSYGIEFMAQKTTGKTTGWIAYTLAKSERKFNKNEINMGKWFPYKYDRRHRINLTANHKISEKIDISASWEFFTGGTITIGEEYTSVIYPESRMTHYSSFSNGDFSSTYYQGISGMTNYIEKRNNYRLPASHCLNLGINFRKKKKYGERIWNFGIYNVYNAMNPQLVYKTLLIEGNEPNEERKTILKKTTIFPIIPSVTYTYKF